MSADLAGTLIRLVFFSCFTADISGKPSLAILVGRLVKIAGGTDDQQTGLRPEEWIFQRRFHQIKEWNLQTLWYSY